MEAFKLADAIRKEIKRQARENPKLIAADHPSEPDVMRVHGELDLYEIAKVLCE
jgi:hypothetical protein